MRPYSQDDRTRVVEFLGQVSRAENLLSYTHAGDFLHYVTNILRGADPAESVFLDEADGEIRAMSLFYPGWAGYTLIVHPDQRGGDGERGWLTWCEQTRWSHILRDGKDTTTIMTDPLDTDSIRAALLKDMGYTIADEPFMAITARDLTDIPAPVLPDGFSIRAARDVSDAGALAAVHSGAFGSNWTPEKYAAVMQRPGFIIEHERVVVAPSGEFAAFLVYWLDPISKSGLFEPVGCHPDYQRRGLVRAMMYDTLKIMADAGMTRALVKHETDNPASTAAYASMGFGRIAAYHEASKPMR